MPPSQTIVVTNSAGKELSNEEIQKYIEELRSLIIGDLKISTRKDDAYLLRFLHCTGFKIEDAFRRLQLLYELRVENLDWFASSHPSEYSTLMSCKTKTLLNGRDKFGRRIFYTRMSTIDPTKTSMQELSRFDDLWMETILDEPDTQAHGICAIIDLAGFSWKMFRWLTPGNVRVSTKRIELFPTKKLVMHVVKSSMLLNAAVAVTFPFLSDKTKEHIHFHYENWPSLHKFIDPEYLPEEYGGQLKEIDFETSNKWLLEQGSSLMEKFKNDNRL